jgi:hypothetical protein
MGRPPISVHYLLVGVVGGLQPDKLARSFKGDLDGMYARVLFSWPAEPPYLPLSNEVAEIEPEIVNALTRIINRVDEKEDSFAPRNIPLSPKAVEVSSCFGSSNIMERTGWTVASGSGGQKALRMSSGSLELCRISPGRGSGARSRSR